jgi:putative membrane protein
MVRYLFRSLPALAAALAVALVGAGSLAIAGDGRGDGHRGHHGSWGHGHGHGHKACYGKRVSGLDERWLKVHVETNLFEIAGGEAALGKASSDDVRELAAHLVADHTAALEQARAVAQRLRVEVPAKPAPLQEWALRAVNQFTGADFDRWFTDLQVEGHKQAITETATEAARGCNRKVRALAAASLPVLEAHLEHAEAVLGGLED